MDSNKHQRVQLNGDTDYEPLCKIKLDRLFETRFPIAYKAKLEELLGQGCFETEQEVRDAMKDMEVELELYYDKDRGFFAVESEAVGSTPIYSPYSRLRCGEPKE